MTTVYEGTYPEAYGTTISRLDKYHTSPLDEYTISDRVPKNQLSR
jgi:hypothetical protein